MPFLFIITGSTAVGKTALSLSLAESLGSPIVGADSRQIFKSLPIGTAAPTIEERRRVRHYFIDQLPLSQSYSAAQYESDCLALLGQLFGQHNAVVMCGGSSMYIDAVRHGLDDIPQASDKTRQALQQQFAEQGLEPLLCLLKQLDPQSYLSVDKLNPRRVIHALEVCIDTGRPYSSFLTGQSRQRNFQSIVIALTRPIDELYERINRRVDAMMAEGLEDEARRALPFRHYGALNTVGYKELFEYFDGQTSLQQAIENIKSHTRTYARKQLTWLRRDSSVVWFDARKTDSVLRFVHDLVYINDI